MTGLFVCWAIWSGFLYRFLARLKNLIIFKLFNLDIVNKELEMLLRVIYLLFKTA